jgi:hypothetical protein
LAALHVKPLRNLEYPAAGELARWIKLTTPNDRTRVIRMLRQWAARREDELQRGRLHERGQRDALDPLEAELLAGAASALRRPDRQARIAAEGTTRVDRGVSVRTGESANAARLAEGRLLPPRRDRSVAIAMPKIEKASDLISAAAALTEATATGELTPGEASDLGRLVEVPAKATEVNSPAERPRARPRVSPEAALDGESAMMRP